MDLVKVLQDYVSIDTTVPPGNNYRQAMEFLVPFFRDTGFTTQLVDIPPEFAEGRTGRVNLVCHRRAPGKPRLIFYGHADVVPAAGWDAFNPKVVDGKMYGRGAGDMKGGIVGLLGALDELKGKQLKYDVSVVVTVDEEVSQSSQLRYIAQYLEPVNGAYVFSLDSSFGFVCVTGLGTLQMEIKIKGKSVHSGLSHLGVNAVENAVPVLTALLRLKAKVTRRRSAIAVSPDTGLKKMQPRLNINKIEGGLKSNIVPDSCIITIDRRLIPEENLADAEKEILNVLANVPGIEWEVLSRFSIPPLPPCRDAIVDELAAAIKAVTGTTGKYGEMGSGDLSHIVVSEWHGASFGLGAIRTECNIHGKDEFVYLADVEALAAIIAKFLE
jgi:succinyl-diaminopimelate desuccinylase